MFYGPFTITRPRLAWCRVEPYKIEPLAVLDLAEPTMQGRIVLTPVPISYPWNDTKAWPEWHTDYREDEWARQFTINHDKFFPDDHFPKGPHTMVPGGARIIYWTGQDLPNLPAVVGVLALDRPRRWRLCAPDHEWTGHSATIGWWNEKLRQPNSLTLDLDPRNA